MRYYTTEHFACQVLLSEILCAFSRYFFKVFEKVIIVTKARQKGYLICGKVGSLKEVDGTHYSAFYYILMQAYTRLGKDKMT